MLLKWWVLRSIIGDGRLIDEGSWSALVGPARGFSDAKYERMT
jgi:hypothetical protein